MYQVWRHSWPNTLDRVASETQKAPHNAWLFCDSLPWHLTNMMLWSLTAFARVTVETGAGCVAAGVNPCRRVRKAFRDFRTFSDASSCALFHSSLRLDCFASCMWNQKTDQVKGCRAPFGQLIGLRVRVFLGGCVRTHVCIDAGPHSSIVILRILLCTCTAKSSCRRSMLSPKFNESGATGVLHTCYQRSLRPNLHFSHQC